MRIVSLLSSATEILFAIGAGRDVVAISHECDYPAQATKLPRATRSLIDSSLPSQEIDTQVKRLMEAGDALYEIDRDLIRSLKPDLIVTQAQCDVCAVRYQDVVDFVAAEPSLSQAQVVALNPQSLSDVLRDIASLGDLAATPQAARSYVQSLQQRIDRIRIPTHSASGGYPLPSGEGGELSSPGEGARVVCIEWVEPLMTAGNWTPELIEIAGGASCLATPGKHSGYVAWSDILAAEPEVLLVAPCGFNLERSVLEARRLTELLSYHTLPAVANNRAFVIDGNAYLNRSGPRLIDSLEILAHLIRPDLFQPPQGDLAQGHAWTRLNA